MIRARHVRGNDAAALQLAQRQVVIVQVDRAVHDHAAGAVDTVRQDIRMIRANLQRFPTHDADVALAMDVAGKGVFRSVELQFAAGREIYRPGNAARVVRPIADLDHAVAFGRQSAATVHRPGEGHRTITADCDRPGPRNRIGNRDRIAPVERQRRVVRDRPRAQCPGRRAATNVHRPVADRRRATVRVVAGQIEGAGTDLGEATDA